MFIIGKDSSNIMFYSRLFFPKAYELYKCQKYHHQMVKVIFRSTYDCPFSLLPLLIFLANKERFMAHYHLKILFDNVDGFITVKRFNDDLVESFSE